MLLCANQMRVEVLRDTLQPSLKSLIRIPTTAPRSFTSDLNKTVNIHVLYNTTRSESWGLAPQQER